jgi:hypothetical protein
MLKLSALSTIVHIEPDSTQSGFNADHGRYNVKKHMGGVNILHITVFLILTSNIIFYNVIHQVPVSTYFLEYRLSDPCWTVNCGVSADIKLP